MRLSKSFATSFSAAAADDNDGGDGDADGGDEGVRVFCVNYYTLERSFEAVPSLIKTTNKRPATRYRAFLCNFFALP